MSNDPISYYCQKKFVFTLSFRILLSFFLPTVYISCSTNILSWNFIHCAIFFLFRLTYYLPYNHLIFLVLPCCIFTHILSCVLTSSVSCFPDTITWLESIALYVFNDCSATSLFPNILVSPGGPCPAQGRGRCSRSGRTTCTRSSCPVGTRRTATHTRTASSNAANTLTIIRSHTHASLVTTALTQVTRPTTNGVRITY